jgi:hypothetical protein
VSISLTENDTDFFNIMFANLFNYMCTYKILTERDTIFQNVLIASLFNYI